MTSNPYQSALGSLMSMICTRSYVTGNTKFDYCQDNIQVFERITSHGINQENIVAIKLLQATTHCNNDWASDMHY